MADVSLITGARILALQGFTQKQIAAQFNVNQGTICRWLKVTLNPALEERLKNYNGEELSELLATVVTSNSDREELPVNEDTEIQRSLSLERLDFYTNEVDKVIRNPKNNYEKIHAIRLGLEIDERRSKLLGNNASPTLNIGGKISYNVVGVDPKELT